MNESINDKLSKILSHIDKRKLMNSTDKLSKLMSSEAGQKLKDSLTEEDKKRILEQFMSLDPAEAGKKLSSSGLETFEKLSPDEILKKLR